MPDQSTKARQNVPYKAKARSRVTNGNGLLPDIDHRTAWVRRFRDVLALHLSDLGGPDNVSHAEAALARRATCLIVELEQMERKFALNNGSTPRQLREYGRASNTLNRLFESLGVKRRLKDVTPSLAQYLHDKTIEAEAEAVE